MKCNIRPISNFMKPGSFFHHQTSNTFLMHKIFYKTLWAFSFSHEVFSWYPNSFQIGSFQKFIVFLITNIIGNVHFSRFCIDWNMRFMWLNPHSVWWISTDEKSRTYTLYLIRFIKLCTKLWCIEYITGWIQLTLNTFIYVFISFDKVHT